MMGYEEFADLSKWETSTDNGKPWGYDRLFGPYCASIDLRGDGTWSWEFSPEEDVPNPLGRFALSSRQGCPSVNLSLREVYGAICAAVDLGVLCDEFIKEA